MLRRTGALLVLLTSAACAEQASMDDLYDASELIASGQVVDLRDSLEKGRRLALVDVSHQYVKKGDLAETTVSYKIFVSFAAGGTGEMETGRDYLLFLERRARYGEFHPVLDGKGIEPLDEKRIAQVTTYSNTVPVCSYDHYELKPDGKNGKCASCGRKTDGSTFTRCLGCAFKEKKCRVCGKAIAAPFEKEITVTVVPLEPLPLELERTPSGLVTLAAGQDSTDIPVGGVVALWRCEDANPMLEIEGDACEVLHFEDADGMLWVGVRAKKKGKVHIRVYAAERDTDTWLAREVDLTIK